MSALSDEPAEEYRFGCFCLDTRRRVLVSGGERVGLSSRGVDILQLLIVHRDRVVTRDEILGHAWPGIVVDPANVNVQMAALRRALGDHSDRPSYITTAAGRGYRFIGDVETLGQASVRMNTIEPAATAGRRLRNVLIGAAGLAAVSAAALLGLNRWRNEALVAARPRLSIVVLPFRNLSGDRDRDYLADAISDDLTTDLTKMTGSLVIARESADTYRNATVPVTQIGRELNVRYALEGSLRLVGALLRVNAQLIDTQSGTHLWAERFDVPSERLADAQAAIEGRIRSSLNIALTEAEARRIQHDRPANPDALDLYYRAMWTYHQDGIAPARPLMERAITLDPGFSEALAQLGWWHALLDEVDGNPNFTEDYREFHELIARALKAQPDNIRALGYRSADASDRGDFRQAERDASAARATDPNSPIASYAWVWVSYGEGNSQDLIKYASEYIVRDPKNPYVDNYKTVLGLAYLDAGDLGRAISVFEQIMADVDRSELTSVYFGNAQFAYLGLMSALCLDGQLNAGQSLYAEYRRLWPHSTLFSVASAETKRAIPSVWSGRFLAGLRLAGIPEYADEHEDYHVDPTSWLAGSYRGAPTPLKVPGATTVDTASLKDLLNRVPNLLLVDSGQGKAVPRGAVWPWSDIAKIRVGTSLEPVIRSIEAKVKGDKRIPLVIMGDAPTGSLSYNVASRLVQSGYMQVYWYRGGEQSWAQAGLPADDRRP